jgi:hypothetical protein
LTVRNHSTHAELPLEFGVFLSDTAAALAGFPAGLAARRSISVILPRFPSVRLII